MDNHVNTIIGADFISLFISKMIKNKFYFYFILFYDYELN